MISRNTKGFTLTELLVATVMLMFVMLLLFSIFGHVATTYQQTESRADSYRDGRAALNLISRELESLVDPVLLMPGSTNIPRIEVAPGDPPSFGFITQLPQKAQAGTDAKSDVCIVGYFVGEDLLSSSQQALYRILIPSRQTYARLTHSLTTLLEVADLSSSAPGAEPIANNVIDFTVRVLDGELREIAPPTGAPNEAYVELTLTVIGNRMAQSYAEASEARKEQIRLKDGRKFVMRTKLGSPSPVATPTPAPAP